MNQLFSRCLFSYLRTIVLIFFCLWLVVIVLDRIILEWYPANRYVPLYNPSLHLPNSTGSYTPYVGMKPEQMDSVDVILYWTPYFANDALNIKEVSIFNLLLGDGNKFHKSDLPLLYRPSFCYKQYPRCFVTTNQLNFKQAKALIFHWRDMPYPFPAERSPNQLYVLYNMESPLHTYPVLSQEENPHTWFNLTATYHSGSDIVLPYGRIVERKTPLPNYDTNHIEMRSKTKLIAWFVSNCNTPIRREDYIKQLSHLISVDIYGDCGPLKCSKGSPAECYQMAAKNYLFYVSFENSNCEDYVTEKLFAILQYDIVPVVLGGANYSRFMPPNSYINANELSPHQLAKLLVDISKDHRRYLKYFEWKRDYIPENDNGSNEALFCALCHKLNSSRTSHHAQYRTNKQINSWYFNGTCNKSRLKFF